jgi:predicted ATPase
MIDYSIPHNATLLLQGGTMTNEQGVSHLTQTISERFIGRAEALSIFHALRAPGTLHNGVYYYGQGGSGKTWILHKIQMEVAGLPGIQVPPIIDFYDTRNNHVHGLQESINQSASEPPGGLHSVRESTA